MKPEKLSDSDEGPPGGKSHSSSLHGVDAVNLDVYNGTVPISGSTSQTNPVYDGDVTRNGNSPQMNYNTFDGNEYTESSLDCQERETEIGSTSKIEPTYTMQDALDYIGFGPYQILLSFYFGLAYMADSMEVMLVSVLVPVMRCVFKEVDPFQRALLPMVAFLGMFISGPYWGKVGDKYGRKSMLILSNILCGYFGVLSALSPVYPWVIGTRLLVSLSLGGFPQMMTYYAEFLPTKSRSTCIVFLALIWAMGACLEIIIAMLTLPSLRWRLFLFLSACPIVLFASLTWIVPESPRHLLAHGRYDEAIAIINKATRMNRKKLPEGRLHQPYEKKLDENNLTDIFIPKYMKTTFLVGLATATLAVSYYGTALITTTLFDKRDGCHGYHDGSASNDRESCQVHCSALTVKDYVDLLLTSLGDAPGVLVCIFLMSRYSRKTSLGLQMAVYTMAMLAINLCAPRNVLVGLFFLARAMADGAGQGMIVYVAEVYPTSVRAIGMGWCVSAKGCGAMLSTLSANIFLEYSSFLAISSLAAAGLVCVVCLVLLPYETKNKRMLDTLEENTT